MASRCIKNKQVAQGHSPVCPKCVKFQKISISPCERFFVVNPVPLPLTAFHGVGGYGYLLKLHNTPINTVIYSKASILLACVGTRRTIDRIACYSLFFFIFTILLCEKDAVTPTGVMCDDRHPGMVLCLAFGWGSAAQTLKCFTLCQTMISSILHPYS